MDFASQNLRNPDEIFSFSPYFYSTSFYFIFVPIFIININVFISYCSLTRPPRSRASSSSRSSSRTTAHPGLDWNPYFQVCQLRYFLSSLKYYLCSSNIRNLKNLKSYRVDRRNIHSEYNDRSQLILSYYPSVPLFLLNFFSIPSVFSPFYHFLSVTFIL